MALLASRYLEETLPVRALRTIEPSGRHAQKLSHPLVSCKPTPEASRLVKGQAARVLSRILGSGSPGRGWSHLRSRLFALLAISWALNDRWLSMA
jgi:hypothetical protein